MNFLELHAANKAKTLKHAQAQGQPYAFADFG
jgi:hypothetical protein